MRDFAAERAFYLRRRWPLVLAFEGFAVFELRGPPLTLFPVERLARNATVKPDTFRKGIQSSIMISAETPQRVDEMVRLSFATPGEP